MTRLEVPAKAPVLLKVLACLENGKPKTVLQITKEVGSSYPQTKVNIMMLYKFGLIERPNYKDDGSNNAGDVVCHNTVFVYSRFGWNRLRDGLVG